MNFTACAFARLGTLTGRRRRCQSRRGRSPGLLAALLLVLLILCGHHGVVLVVDAQQTDPTTTNGATAPRKIVQGEIYIELTSLVDLMPESIQEVYEVACSNFFGNSLAQWSPPVVNIQATLLEQTKVVVSPPSSSAGNDEGEYEEPSGGVENDNEDEYEYEQAAAGGDQEQAESLPTLGPLLTLLQVQGEIIADAEDVTELNFYLLLVIMSDKKGFMDELKAASLFFRPVQDLEALDPAIFTPEVTTAVSRGPVGDDGDDDDDDDLAAVGIALAAIGGFLLVAITFSVGKSLTKGHVRELHPAEELPTLVDQSRPVAAPVTAPVTRAATTPPSESRTPAGPPIKASATTTAADDDSQEFDDILPAGLIPHRPVGAEEELGEVPTTEAGGGMTGFIYNLEADNLDQQTSYTAGISGIPGTMSTIGGGGGDPTAAQVGTPNWVSREVLVPPGKLGVVIDATLQGPVVRRVYPGSLLDGVVRPGDIIVAINGVDTRAMPATAITSLMAKTANLERRIGFLSPDDNRAGS